MILVLSSPGHVAAAVNDAVESIEEEARRADPGGDLAADLRGCRAVVYVPEPRLLDASGAYDADVPLRVDRVAEVLRGARAAREPAIELFIHVVSFDAPSAEEDELLRSAGLPFTVVRCAPLVDELADATNLHTSRPLWLERGADVELASRAALTRTVRSALLWEAHRGTMLAVPAVRMDIGEAMERAAAVAGAAVKIHLAAPGVSSSMRKLYAWLGVTSLEVEAICDRLVRRRRPATAGG